MLQRSLLFALSLTAASMAGCSSSSSSSADASPSISGTLGGKAFSTTHAFAMVSGAATGTSTDHQALVLADNAINCATMNGKHLEGERMVVLPFAATVGVQAVASEVDTKVGTAETKTGMLSGTIEVVRFATRRFIDVREDPSMYGHVRVELKGAGGDTLSGELDYVLCN